MVIANQTKSHFVTLSAVLVGKADLRVVIDKAQERRKLHGVPTILFVKQVVETLYCHAAGVVLAAEVVGEEAGWSSMAEWYGAQKRRALEL